jgi:hypothetical protein
MKNSGYGELRLYLSFAELTASSAFFKASSSVAIRA